MPLEDNNYIPVVIDKKEYILTREALMVLFTDEKEDEDE